MFWKFNFANTSNIDSLLQKEDVTLEDLMDQEDIVQECQGRHASLVEFLIRPENLEALINYISEEPSPEENETVRFKYSNVACELLTCDVPIINETLAGSPNLLSKLCSFIETDAPLNPLMASFFSKTMITMITRKTDENWFSYQFACLQVFDFIKTRTDFVPLLVRHIGTSAIMDLVLRLMVYIEGPELRQAFTQWLCDQRLMDRLVTCFDVTVEKERHVNVSQLLCDMIGVCRGDNSITRGLPGPLPTLMGLGNGMGMNGGLMVRSGAGGSGSGSGGGMDLDASNQYPFLKELESKETITLMLNHMLGGRERSESAVFYGINVLIALMSIQKTCVYVNDDDSGHASDRGDCGSPIATEDSGDGSPVNGPVVTPATDEPAGPEKRGATATPPAIWKLHPSVRNVVEALMPWMGDIHHILLNPPSQHAVKTTVGVLEPPLGAVRLQIARLISTLVSLKYRPISERLVELGTFKVLIDLFFEYSWNNFLHSHVENCVTTLLTLDEKPAGQQQAVRPGNGVAPEIVELVMNKVLSEKAGDDSPEDGSDGSGPSSPEKKNGDVKETSVDDDGAARGEELLSEKDFELFDPLLVHLLLDIDFLKVILQHWYNVESPIPGRKRTGYLGHLMRIVGILNEKREVEKGASESDRLLASLIRTAESRLSEDDSVEWFELVTSTVPKLNQKCFTVLPNMNEFDGSRNDGCGDGDVKNLGFSSESNEENIRRHMARFQRDFAKMDVKDADDDDNFNDEDESDFARGQFEEMCSLRNSGDSAARKVEEEEEDEEDFFGSSREKKEKKDSPGPVITEVEQSKDLSEVEADLSGGDVVAAIAEPEDPWGSASAGGSSVQEEWADFSAFESGFGAATELTQQESMVLAWETEAQKAVGTVDPNSAKSESVESDASRTWAEIASGSSIAVATAEDAQTPHEGTDGTNVSGSGSSDVASALPNPVEEGAKVLQDETLSSESEPKDVNSCESSPPRANDVSALAAAAPQEA